MSTWFLVNAQAALIKKYTMAAMSVDDEDGSLFSDDWTGKEELKLLEAIDEYGYGNW